MAIIMLIFTGFVFHFSTLKAEENLYIQEKNLIWKLPYFFISDGEEFQIYFTNPLKSSGQSDEISTCYFVSSRFLKSSEKTQEPHKLERLFMRDASTGKTMFATITRNKADGTTERREIPLPLSVIYDLNDLYQGITIFTLKENGPFETAMKKSFEDSEINAFYKGCVNEGMKLYKKQQYYDCYNLMLPYAEKGNWIAQYIIGKMFLQVPVWHSQLANVKKQKKNKRETFVRNEGLKWMRKAASNYVHARQVLATYLLENSVNEQEKEEGLTELERLAKDGNLASMKTLADYYFWYDGKKPDSVKSIYWLEKIAESRKDTNYIHNLISELRHARNQQVAGSALAKEYENKYHYYCELLAGGGDEKALDEMGSNYEFGFLGYEKDWNKALEFYNRAAKKGYSRGKENYEQLLTKIKKKEDEERAKTLASNTPKPQQTSKPKSTTKSNSSAKSSSNTSKNKGGTSKSTTRSTSQKKPATPSASNNAVKRTFYNTWAYHPSGNGFWVAGKGLSERNPTFNITDSKIIISGDWGKYNIIPEFNFVKSNSDGSRLYRQLGDDMMNIEIVVSKDKNSLNLITYILKTDKVNTIENFVSDPQLRKEIIASNSDGVRNVDYSLLNNNIMTPDYNPSTRLRYPEYNKYNENGKFSDRKYNEVTRANCTHCKGTGISPIPVTSAGSRSAYSNDAGHRCPYCKELSRHWHNRCSTCSK